MKKNLIIIGIIIVAGIVGISVLFWNLQFKSVAFELKGNSYSVNLFNDEEAQVNSLSTSTTVRLAEGSYTYKVMGDGFGDASVAFEVTGNDTKVNVSPVYSSEKLNELLREEQASIESTIKVRHPDVTYRVTELALYEQGEWASAILTPIVDPRQQPDRYRTVLLKEDNQWKIVAPAQITLTKAQYPTIPDSVIYRLYTSGQ